MRRLMAFLQSAKNSNNFGLESLLIPAIGILAVAFFIGSPILFIVGACKIISQGFIGAAEGILVESSVGVLLGYVVGLTLISVSVENQFFPYPSRFLYNDYSVYEQRRKANIKGVICLTLIMLAIALVVVGITLVGMLAANKLISGIAFLIVGILSIATIVLGVLAKIFWG